MNERKQIASKWVKTAVLMEDRQVVPHIPETVKYTAGSFRRMLDKYGGVVLKPDIGTGGGGVIWVGKRAVGYLLRHRAGMSSHAALPVVLQRLKRLMGGRRYLIQRGIQLAHIDGRPLDYRVKIVKENDRWLTKAIVGRWARKGLFVTNLCRGGTQLSSVAAIRRSLPSLDARRKKREMRKLAYHCKDIFMNCFPNADQLGFDFGLDRSGKIWIFEVNTRPH